MIYSEVADKPFTEQVACLSGVPGHDSTSVHRNLILLAQLSPHDLGPVSIALLLEHLLNYFLLHINDPHEEPAVCLKCVEGDVTYVFVAEHGIV